MGVKGWWDGAGGSDDDDEDGSTGSCVNVKNTKRIGEIRGKQHYSGYKLEKESIKTGREEDRHQTEQERK